MNAYLQAWPTPTPMPTVDATPALGAVLEGMDTALAESLVQGYQQANNHGALELLMFGILALLIVGGIWSIIRHVQRI